MRHILFFVLVINFFVPASAKAQQGSPIQMSPPSSAPSDTLVIGGVRVQDAKKWPATFKFGKDDNYFCTSTAVGPRVILTAAHCIADKAAGIVIPPGGDAGTVAITCFHHPAYTECDDDMQCPADKTTSADYALCLAASDLKLKEFETLNTNLSVPAKGSELLLTGYGCNENLGSDKGYGFLFEGETKVTALPGESPERWSKNYIFTKGNAALCFGDSGGPSYKLLDKEGKSRVLIGVNSRSDMKKDDFSYLSATSSADFISWAKSWSESNKVKICGMHPGVTGCHP